MVGLIVLAAVVAVAVFLIVRNGAGDAAPRTVEEVVRAELDKNPDARAEACGEIEVLGPANQGSILEIIDSLPPETRDSFVETLRQRGRDEGWLPPEAVSWQFPEVRRAIVALIAACGGG